MVKTLGAVLALLPLLAPGEPQASERDRQKFESKRREELVEAGNRHVDLGIWCRDKGLTIQSAAEFVRAVEVSEGMNFRANNILSVMRRYDQAFWKKHKRGSLAARKSYVIKAERVREKNEKAILGLAKWAWDRELHDEAMDIYEAMLDHTGEALEFDSKERLVLEFGTIPAEAAASIREGAIEINGRLYLRDGFLSNLPDVGAISEHESEALRVRAPLPPERVEALHKLGTALLPHLEEELGARPARRMDLFIFPTREGFEGWLESAGMGGHRAGAGLADPRSFTALVCAEDFPDELVDGLALHELTHLFWYGVSPSVMPDWFDEGFAETFGGHGTFRWEGDELVTGGLMHDDRLAPLRDGEGLFSLKDLLAGDALSLLSSDRERGLLFYAQSWALVRFLRQGASEDLQERFDIFVTMCAGSAAGADAKDVRKRNTQPATEIFNQLFGDQLRTLERDFQDWLTTL